MESDDREFDPTNFVADSTTLAASESVDTPTANKGAKLYKYQSSYDKVQEFVRKSEFGVVEKEVRHFTHQIKSAARWYFPDDSTTYEIADTIQSRAIRLVVIMRLMTLASFLVFTNHAYETILGQPASIAVLAFPTKATLEPLIPALPPLFLNSVSAVLQIAFAAIILGAFRVLFRGVFLYLLIQKDVEVARGKLKSAHKDLIAACSKVAGAMSVIEDRALWPEWAGKSAAVALWNAMRADYVDRYSTTSLWKIRRSFEVLEWAFRIIKVTIALAAFALLFWQLNLRMDDLLAEKGATFVMGATTYMILAVLIWDRLFRASNEFITIIFKEPGKEATDKDTGNASARTNYFGEFETQVQNLANMTLTMSK